MNRIVKRSVTIAGHRTSLSLEEPFWTALKAEARARRISVNALVEEIDAARPLDQQGGNLSSALRVYLFNKARGQ